MKHTSALPESDGTSLPHLRGWLPSPLASSRSSTVFSTTALRPGSTTQSVLHVVCSAHPHTARPALTLSSRHCGGKQEKGTTCPHQPITTLLPEWTGVPTLLIVTAYVWPHILEGWNQYPHTQTHAPCDAKICSLKTLPMTIYSLNVM